MCVLHSEQLAKAGTNGISYHALRLNGNARGFEDEEDEDEDEDEEQQGDLGSSSGSDAEEGNNGDSLTAASAIEEL